MGEPWPRASGLLLWRWPVLRAGFCWLCQCWRQLSLCACVASLLELSSTLGLGELLAECVYPLSRPKSISQPQLDLSSDPSIRICSPKERNVAPALPSSIRASEETAEAVPELWESGGFPQGFLCLVLSCPLRVCPKLGRQDWRLQGQTSEVSGYFWNFIEERRDREPRAGCTMGMGASSRKMRTEKRHKSPLCRSEPWRGTAVRRRGNKRGRFRLDVRKNLPSSRQAGEPPPLGVKDVLKHPRQMFVYVNTSVPWAREQVWRLLGLQPCFSVICMHILACERVRSPMRLSHHKHAFWIWNRSSRTYCFCCVFVICSESC